MFKVIFDLLLYYKRVLEILGSRNAVVRHRVSESRSIIGALGELRSCLKTFKPFTCTLDKCDNMFCCTT
jgi:hypothetical protein